MSDIDYERLAKAAYKAGYPSNPSVVLDRWWDEHDREIDGPRTQRIARAVVAALAEQGLVVLRRDDAERARRWHTDAEWAGATVQDDQDARDRISAALAANPKEDGDG